jgi:hypothetical protein
MSKVIFTFLILFVLIYPKFPLAAVSGSFVAIRLEDFVVLITLVYLNIKLIKNYPLHRSLYLYLFIAAVAAFSGIFLTKTASLSQGLIQLARRFEYLSLFFVGFNLLNNKKILLPYIIHLLIYASLIISLYGIGQQFFNFPIISTTNSEFSKGLALTLGAGARINSTFAGHYDLAAFMLFPLLIIIALIPLSKHKIILSVIWLLNYWVMLMSASRITFASLFISTALLLFLIKQLKWLPIFIFISICGFLLSPQLRGRYLELITNYLIPKVHAQQEVIRPVFTPAAALQPAANPEDRSLSIRLNAEWPKALRAFYKNPLFGSGFSSIGLATDNEYLRLLAESGIFGFLAFILIFYRYIKLIFNKIKKYTPNLENNFLAAILCAIVGLLINAVFIDIFTASKIAFTAWLFIGITTKIASDYEK